MKRLTTLLIAIFCVGVLSAQEPYKVFCSISGSYRNTELQSTTRVTINYGQEDLRRSYLVDEQGKELDLKSVTAVANYLSKLGWEFEDSHIVGENQLRCVWIMSKMVTDDSQITEGFTTALMYKNGE